MWGDDTDTSDNVVMFPNSSEAFYRYLADMYAKQPAPNFSGRGTCADYDNPSMWDTTKDYATFDEARFVCNNCPVQKECLAYAEKHGERGIWGGRMFGATEPRNPDVCKRGHVGKYETRKNGTRVCTVCAHDLRVAREQKIGA